jgi:hypothetical protein
MSYSRAAAVAAILVLATCALAQTSFFTGAGPGVPPHVKGFRGVGGGETHSFFAYDPGFTGGVTVASGDVNGDSIPDIITGTADNASHVKVFNGASGALIHSFFAYAGFTGGVTVASGDVDGDGFADIITGAGSGSTHVKVFSGQGGAEIRSFFALLASRAACGSQPGTSMATAGRT